MSNTSCFPRLLPLRRLMIGVFGVLLANGCGHAGAGVATAPHPADRVNVGYASFDRRDVTGAVASLGERELRDLHVTHTEELLMDRFPGLLVTRRSDGSFSVRIRGARSLLGDHDPLVVVDGMPMGPGALSDLVPGNIVRIDVLKDAGSTGAYGARGANGVILVTTRRLR